MVWEAYNLRGVQILLGRAKVNSTVRYLGMDVEDALELAERTDVWPDPQSAVQASAEGT